MNNKTYIIIDRLKVTQEMISSAIQTSMTTLRTNNDFSKAVLKWEGSTPECFKGIKTYTHQQILEELAKEEWINPELYNGKD